MIQHAPILAENRPEWHNFHNLKTLEEDGAHHLTFNAVLFSYWWKNPAWSNVKMYTRMTNRSAAWHKLYNYFFSMNAIQTQTKSVISTLDSLRYEECCKNFTFDAYVLKHGRTSTNSCRCIHSWTQ
jgi:hypothetical protein